MQPDTFSYSYAHGKFEAINNMHDQEASHFKTMGQILCVKSTFL